MQFFNTWGLPMYLKPGKSWIVLVGDTSKLQSPAPGQWELRFDIPLLTRRLVGVIDWIEGSAELRPLRIGLFGASTGAAAALLAAVERPDVVHAVVSRGGRTDLAGPALARVKAPTLQIVGGEDLQVLDMNRESANALQCEQRLEVVAGATHLFEEPGTLEEVARLAGDWFEQHLRAPVKKAPSR